MTVSAELQKKIEKDTHKNFQTRRQKVSESHKMSVLSFVLILFLCLGGEVACVTDAEFQVCISVSRKRPVKYLIIVTGTSCFVQTEKSRLNFVESVFKTTKTSLCSAVLHAKFKIPFVQTIFP